MKCRLTVHWYSISVHSPGSSPTRLQISARISSSSSLSSGGTSRGRCGISGGWGSSDFLALMYASSSRPTRFTAQPRCNQKREREDLSATDLQRFAQILSLPLTLHCRRGNEVELEICEVLWRKLRRDVRRTLSRRRDSPRYQRRGVMPPIFTDRHRFRVRACASPAQGWRCRTRNRCQSVKIGDSNSFAIRSRVAFSSMTPICARRIEFCRSNPSDRSRAAGRWSPPRPSRRSPRFRQSNPRSARPQGHRMCPKQQAYPVCRPPIERRSTHSGQAFSGIRFAMADGRVSNEPK